MYIYICIHIIRLLMAGGIIPNVPLVEGLFESGTLQGRQKRLPETEWRADIPCVSKVIPILFLYHFYISMG